MSIEELMSLQTSDEAPFNHKDYTVWLHNKIVEEIKNDIDKYREGEFFDKHNGHKVYKDISSLSSLKIIK